MLQSNRNVGLDVLRSIAVWNVLIMHLTLTLYSAKAISIVWLPLPDGVDLFFVLSGFLIGRILINSFVDNQYITTNNILHFLSNRWFRTLPNYYFLTAIVFGLTILTSKHLFNPIYNLLFLQNISSNIFNFYPETWSLCIEEWFYLLFPLSIFIISIFNKRKITKTHFLLISLILIFTSPIIRYIHAKDFNYKIATDFFEYRITTYIRLDAIAYGTIAAFIKQYYNKIWIKNINRNFIVGSIILLINTVLLYLILNGYTKPNHSFLTNLNFIFNSIGLVLMIPKIETIKIKNDLLTRFFTFTSIISYSMYLLQLTIVLKIMIVIYVVIGCKGNMSLVIFVITYIILVYLFSYINYKYFESKFLKIRDKVNNKYFT